MSKPSIDYSLYLVTEPYRIDEHDHYFHKIDDALRGGVTLIQFREKEASSKQLFEIAGQLREMASCIIKYRSLSMIGWILPWQ
ncbi:thiamine phosphate synthase [Terrilactibacillus sp. S3-3]|nr:thiamine phosphate synthase [Terrilactibacillus sp. S3-3]